MPINMGLFFMAMKSFAIIRTIVNVVVFYFNGNKNRKCNYKSNGINSPLVNWIENIGHCFKSIAY